VFDVNVLGLVRVTLAALPALRASQHGAIDGGQARLRLRPRSGQS
jgi:hypothetical protein